ncbi:MAG: galactokinase [Proteobacteria bacterium]|nr:MAG: galactokinase [Pseudomonadota bacterium]
MIDDTTTRPFRQFYKAYGMAPSAKSEAPGRVNLIGEHTDYNDGFVLPTAIPQKTFIEISRRSDDQVHLFSSDIGPDGEQHSYQLGSERPLHRWFDYFQGVTWLLREKGFAISGFNLIAHSDIPMGAGLSSSAALLVALFRAFRDQFQLKLSDVDIALMSQDVENNFVGAHVGIMDQMASSLADRGTALFLDTQSLNFERIGLPDSDVDIFVINSGVKHSHSTSGYNTRRRECEEACRLLGVKSLRAVENIDDVLKIADPFRSRARHVVSENLRVINAVKAIGDRDMVTLGRLMIESHASMRDDYKISVPEIDLLVNIALSHAEVFGARLTGGGFGGSIVGICQHGEARRICEAIADRYQRETEYHATILVPQEIH